MSTKELEIQWIAEAMLLSWGMTSEGWWATDYEVGGVRIGPFKSLDDCARATLEAGYSIPGWQRPD